MAFSVTAGAKGLCPSRAVADPLQIREHEITDDRYFEAIQFLKSGLKEALRRNKSLEQLQDDLSFWIPYANAILAIEGYALKQRALQHADEVERFCEFLSTTTWSD